MARTLVLKGTNFSAHKIETVTFGEDVPCTGITLDEQTKSVTSLSPFTLVATPAPSNTTDEVSWTSSDSNVATVANGVVTPVGLGEVMITATCGSYSATCDVTINNVVPSYKAVCGYNPNKRTSNGDAVTIGKSSGETSAAYVIATDQGSGSNIIDSYGYDTSPYRFVPIIIPVGATKIIISTTIGNLKTRALYFDSTKAETVYSSGACKCVQGLKDSYDQSSTQNSPVELTIPTNVDGLDSVAVALAFVNAQNSNQDYSSEISIAFAYGE